MTRDMLIKLLADDHEVYYDSDMALHCCSCGKEFGTHRQWAEHATDLILLGFAR